MTFLWRNKIQNYPTQSVTFCIKMATINRPKKTQCCIFLNSFLINLSRPIMLSQRATACRKVRWDSINQWKWRIIQQLTNYRPGTSHLEHNYWNSAASSCMMLQVPIFCAILWFIDWINFVHDPVEKGCWKCQIQCLRFLQGSPLSSLIGLYWELFQPYWGTLASNQGIENFKLFW